MEVKVTLGKRWLGAAHVRMCMSMGSPAFEGESLALLLKWLRSQFKKTTLILADDLQRHNIKGGDSTSAVASGDAWLDRNRSTILEFSENVRLTRWLDWRMQPSFPGYLKAIRETYETSEVFKRNLDLDAERYSKSARIKSQMAVYLTTESILEYIFEELAVIAILEEQTNSVEVYPGTALKVTRLFKTQVPNPHLQILSQLRFISVLFDKLKSTPVKTDLLDVANRAV
jgi:tRNA-dependent cyclodipeptide synthase